MKKKMGIMLKADDAFSRAVKQLFPDYVWEQYNHLGLDSMLSALEQKHPTLIFIDSWCSDQDEQPLKHLDSLRLKDLRDALNRENQLPTSLKLLKLLRGMTKNRDSIIVYCVDSPGIALTQEILRLGCDWVCSSRIPDQSLVGIITKIRKLQKRH